MKDSFEEEPLVIGKKKINKIIPIIVFSVISFIILLIIFSQFVFSNTVLVIRSYPQQAEVYLDGKLVGKTPLTLERLKPKEYLVEIKLPGRATWSQKVSLSLGERVPIIANLLHSFAVLEVDSTPEDATVFINDVNMGKTPFKSSELTEGKIKLKISLKGYEVYEEEFDLIAGDVKKIKVSLKEAFGSLYVNSNPQGAKVYLDGREVGLTPYKNLKQPVGEYALRIELAGFSVYEERIVIFSSKKTEKFVKLSVGKGSLVVITTPEGATVKIDNEIMPGKTPMVIRSIAPGKHQIQIELEGYIPWVQEFEHFLDRTTEIKVTLAKLP